MMRLKELIELEINKVPEENLAELYQMVQRFSQEKVKQKTGVLSKLTRIKIQAPEDFSQNIDSYLNGEK